MLRAEGVSYGYIAGDGAGAPLAVADASFTATPGSLIALTGPNGSGKSTLIKLLARVLQPQGGEIVFDGRTLRDWSAREFAQVTGYLPQEPDVSFPMRAIDIVASGRAPFLTRFGWESESDYATAAEALALCDVAHLSDRYLDEMSGGERKRVFLARVLAGKPKLVLLDEPLAALDVAHVQQFSKLLRQIVDQTGATVIFASHDLNWAAAYSDRVMVMRGGGIAADVAPDEIMKPELVRELFGFDARTVTADGRSWIVPAL
ncbi:MAG TPA: ABC transporter ATP-binding protein [Thermoanaerobaculia bacterium]